MQEMVQRHIDSRGLSSIEQKDMEVIIKTNSLEGRWNGVGEAMFILTSALNAMDQGEPDSSNALVWETYGSRGADQLYEPPNHWAFGRPRALETNYLEFVGGYVGRNYIAMA